MFPLGLQCLNDSFSLSQSTQCGCEIQTKKTNKQMQETPKPFHFNPPRWQNSDLFQVQRLNLPSVSREGSEGGRYAALEEEFWMAKRGRNGIDLHCFTKLRYF